MWNNSINDWVSSKDIDNITIENLGEGKYGFTDSQATIVFKYSHKEEEIMYVYKSVSGPTLFKSIQKMSDFALGKPGKLILEISEMGFELRYKLDD